MEVIKTLIAGSAGTKRYQKEYGTSLVCVRYRRDEAAAFPGVSVAGAAEQNVIRNEIRMLYL